MGEGELEMKLKYEEVKESPKDAAITMYKFICADLEEGFCYGVSFEAYNKAMAGIGSEMTISENCTSRKFAEDFYAEFKRING